MYLPKILIKMRGAIWILLVSGLLSMQSDAKYKDICAQIIAEKNTKSTHKIISENYLFTTLVHQIFPHWEGTKWDFNGISNEPKNGEIACGYFVSTTLKHIGFNLNRYKTAQHAAAVIIKVLCGSQYSVFNNKNLAIDELKKHPNTLFVVGLDYHVGFIANIDNQIYFIHSDYFNGKVVKELAEESIGFSATKSYYIGTISKNEQLIRKWKNYEKIY